VWLVDWSGFTTRWSVPWRVGSFLDDVWLYYTTLWRVCIPALISALDSLTRLQSRWRVEWFPSLAGGLPEVELQRPLTSYMYISRISNDELLRLHRHGKTYFCLSLSSQAYELALLYIGVHLDRLQVQGSSVAGRFSTYFWTSRLNWSGLYLIDEDSIRILLRTSSS
jgi:hypothetical protein